MFSFGLINFLNALKPTFFKLLLLSINLTIFLIAFNLTLFTFPITYFVLRHKYQYWKKKGVKGPSPRLLLGNVGKAVILKKSLGEIFTNIYNDFKDQPIVGAFRLLSPVLVIRDPELVFQVTTKSFGSFEDNEIVVKKWHDPLFGRNLFVLKGEEWKKSRSVMTPALTIEKMKEVYPGLEENGLDLVSFIKNRPEATNGDGYDVKELSTRYNLDTIAEVAFSIKGDSLEKPDGKFWKLSQDYFAPGGWGFLNFYLLLTYPFLSKFLPLRICSRKVEKKLTSIVSRTLEHRLKTNTERKDFLNSLTHLKKSSEDKSFTDIDIVSHIGSFLFEGYEATSLTMTFALEELASNPEAQTSLRQEIDRAFDENHNKIPCDVLQFLPYLDGVVNETLRLYPPLPILQKMCTENFTFEFRDGRESVTIEKGTPIVIPVSGLQHDPKYYQFPDTFIPDRFVRANRDQIRPHTFLPFGEGPRACLAQDFAMLQLKIGIAYIIRNFELFINRKTTLPIKYNPLNFLISPLEPVLLDFKKIR